MPTVNRREAAQRPRRRAVAAADRSWYDDAACRLADEEPGAPIFFAEAGHDAHSQVADEEAKAICAGCPVIEQCLSHALAAPERYGVWGGLSAHERDKMRRAHLRL